MRALSGAVVLDLWERGAALHPLDRSLLVLGEAHPSSAEGAADWPLGRRNRALLELHASWFGPALQGWTSCPACGEQVALELDAGRLSRIAENATPRESVTVDEHVFRLPTTRDLVHVIAIADPRAAAVGLLERCRVDGPAPTAWSDELIEIAGERLAAADELAETRLALTCPSCAHAWEDAIDVGRFLWAEIDASARRALRDVHALAAAYGWTESETLALSPARRAMYLDMVQG